MSKIMYIMCPKSLRGHDLAPLFNKNSGEHAPGPPSNSHPRCSHKLASSNNSKAATNNPNENADSTIPRLA